MKQEPALTPVDHNTSRHQTTVRDQQTTSEHPNKLVRDLQTSIGDHNTTASDIKLTPGSQTSDVEMTEELKTQEREMVDKLKKYLVFSMSKGNPTTFKVKRFKPGAEEAFPGKMLLSHF